MFESFSKQYCPHCHGLLLDNDFLPDKCPYCGEAIVYSGLFGVQKGFEIPKEDRRFIAAIAAALGAAAIFYKIYDEYPDFFRKLAAFVRNVWGMR